jgi:hypothetical protein
MNRTADLMKNLGDNNLLDSRFSKIKNTCFLGLGDSDQMVTKEETQNAKEKISNATFFSLPNTLHPISKVDAHVLAKELNSLLTQY